MRSQTRKGLSVTYLDGETLTSPTHVEQIRTVLAQHARLSVPVETLTDDSDLYEAGLTSLTTVNLMLALEDHFDIEFSDKMLGRKTFESMRSLSEAIEELVSA